jgi:3'-5' exoribonuclease
MKLMVKDIKPNEIITSIFAIDFFQLKQSKNSDYYLFLKLCDKTGSIKGFIWHEALNIKDKLNENSYVKVTGITKVLGDSLVIDIFDITPIGKEEVDLRDFFETVKEGIDYWFQELINLVDLVKNDFCKELIFQFLNDQKIMRLFKTRPAGATIHHNYIGGLLQHTVNTMILLDKIADTYNEKLDRDLLLTGAFLHDIGKVEELKYDGTIRYTIKGELLGHITLGILLLEKKIERIRNFPYELALLLKHMVLSHHGKLEYGSPVQPKIPEAKVLSIIEGTDAEINNKVQSTRYEKNILPLLDRTNLRLQNSKVEVI